MNSQLYILLSAHSSIFMPFRAQINRVWPYVDECRQVYLNNLLQILREFSAPVHPECHHKHCVDQSIRPIYCIDLSLKNNTAVVQFADALLMCNSYPSSISVFDPSVNDINGTHNCRPISELLCTCALRCCDICVQHPFNTILCEYQRKCLAILNFKTLTIYFPCHFLKSLIIYNN